MEFSPWGAFSFHPPVIFLFLVLPYSFACILGESVPHLSTALSSAISLIYTAAHADDRNRWSINYAWNYIPIFRFSSSPSADHISAYWKTLNISSAANWNTEINGSISSSRIKHFSAHSPILSRQHTSLVPSTDTLNFLQHCFLHDYKCILFQEKSATMVAFQFSEQRQQRGKPDQFKKKMWLVDILTFFLSWRHSAVWKFWLFGKTSARPFSAWKLLNIDKHRLS